MRLEMVDLTPVQDEELLELRGGGDGGESFAKELGTLVGMTAGALFNALVSPMPMPASFFDPAFM